MGRKLNDDDLIPNGQRVEVAVGTYKGCRGWAGEGFWWWDQKHERTFYYPVWMTWFAPGIKTRHHTHYYTRRSLRVVAWDDGTEPETERMMAIMAKYRERDNAA